VLETDPLSMEAHAAITRLLNESGGRLAGLEHLREASARHPHHAGLARLAVEFTDVEGPEGLEVVRRLLALTPSDAWAVRELAIRLLRRQRAEEALVAADEAAVLDPHSASTHGIRGFVLAAAGKREAAREAYRTALRYTADYVSAFHGLLDEQNDVADRLRAIRFLQAELRRQVVFGDALPALRDAAHGVLPDDEMLAFLEEARMARPDLLGAWTTVGDHLVAMGRLDEAAARAREATDRFPLVVEPLLQLAAIERLRADEAARRETLRRALEIEPGHARATRELADALVEAGDIDEGLRLLQASCERSPQDVSNHGALADLFARAGRMPEAFARAQRALEIDPDYDWAWGALLRWATTPDLKDEALAVANAVAAARPHVAGAHLGRAQVLGARRGREAEVLAALKQALACGPRLTDAHDQYAVALAEVGRWDEALAACRPAAFGDTPPLILRGRRAWILAARGEVAQAIEEMEVVVAGDPTYLWGFLRLDDWYFGAGNYVQARRVSERALLLAPNLAEPALGLFDACLALRDYEACRRALDAVKGTTDRSFVFAREVQLACARHRPGEGVAPFEKLASLPQSSPWALVEASRALNAQGASHAVRAAFDRIVTSGDRPDADMVGAAWAKVIAARSDLAVMTRIRRFIAAGRVGQAAIAAHVEALAGDNRKGALGVLWLIARKAMASATAVWGAFGYALVHFDWHRRAARWMHDHARRPDVESWMLRNVAVALVARGRYDEARAAHERALTLPPDHVTDTNRRWLALHDALAGRFTDATRLLDACAPSNDKLSALLEAYARALLTAAAEGPTDRAKRRQAAAAVEPLHSDAFEDDEARLARRLVRQALRG
jgi:tetratricopeptide (TPR) repeat protein